MTSKHKNFKKHKLESLQDMELALAYLNEALNDEDRRVFLLAL